MRRLERAIFPRPSSAFLAEFVRGLDRELPWNQLMLIRLGNGGVEMGALEGQE